METKPLILILMGPPGSGKGTHSGPLSEYLKLPHISTGDLFREHIRSKTPLGLQAKLFIDDGSLVPDGLVLDMLFDRVSKPDCEHGYILDGFPRTLAQAKALEERLANNYRVLVLHLNLSDETIIERITGRIACKSCGRPFHQTFDPPKKPMECDGCKGALYQREDDREEIIRKRLEVYRSQTKPLIEYYGTEQGALREVSSEDSKAEVFDNIIEAISLTGCLQS